MAADYFPVLILISSVLILLCLSFLVLYLQSLYNRIEKLEKHRKSDQEYLVEFVTRYNLLCKEVMLHSDHIHHGQTSKLLIYANFEALKKKIATLEDSVSYILNQWKDEWSGGESWKNGFRPDGSDVEEEE